MVDPDAELPFGVGDYAVTTVLNRNADACQGGVGCRVQYDPGDRSGLSDDRPGEQTGNKK